MYIYIYIYIYVYIYIYLYHRRSTLKASSLNSAQYMLQKMLIERLYCSISEIKERELKKFGKFHFTNLGGIYRYILTLSVFFRNAAKSLITTRHLLKISLISSRTSIQQTSYTFILKMTENLSIWLLFNCQSLLFYCFTHSEENTVSEIICNLKEI